MESGPLPSELELLMKVYLRYKWDVPAGLLANRHLDPRAWGEGIRLFDRATKQLQKGINREINSKPKQSRVETVPEGGEELPSGKKRRVRKRVEPTDGSVLPKRRGRKSKGPTADELIAAMQAGNDFQTLL